MKKHVIRKIIVMTLVMTFLTNQMCMITFAKASYGIELQTKEQAKEYLLENKKVTIVKNGKTEVVEYDFKTEEDLDKAAEYILENGSDSFNLLVQERMQNNVRSGEATVSQSTRDADYISARVTIPSTNGTHSVSHTFTGIADFEEINEGIYTSNYIARLSYNVAVKNGIITGMSSMRFQMLSIDNAELKDVTLNHGHSETGASVTANYTMSRTIEETILGITITTYEVETTDYFVLYAYL